MVVVVLMALSGCGTTTKGRFDGVVTGQVSTADGKCVAAGLHPEFSPDGGPTCFARPVGRLGDCVSVTSHTPAVNDAPPLRFPVDGIAASDSCGPVTTTAGPAPTTSTTDAQGTTTTAQAMTTTTALGTFNYDTLGALNNDSADLFGATLGSAQNGLYHLDVNTFCQFTSDCDNEDYYYVSSALVSAAHLVVGADYIVFWADDVTTDPPSFCVVGGVRGIFAYNIAAGTVTRLDNSTTSQIPRTQSVASFDAELAPLRSAPRAPNFTRPVCSFRVTGIPAVSR
jgi:hypothetical protein